MSRKIRFIFSANLIYSEYEYLCFINLLFRYNADLFYVSTLLQIIFSYYEAILHNVKYGVNSNRKFGLIGFQTMTTGLILQHAPWTTSHK